MISKKKLRMRIISFRFVYVVSFTTIDSIEVINNFFFILSVCFKTVKMPMSCVAPNCKNNYENTKSVEGKRISFHRFVFITVYR